MSQDEATNPKKKIKREVIEETESSNSDDNDATSDDEGLHECCDCGNPEYCPHQCEKCEQPMCNGCKETTERVWDGVRKQMDIFCGICHIGIASEQWHEQFIKGRITQFVLNEKLEDLEELKNKQYE